MHSLISFSTLGMAGLLVTGAVGACSNGGDEGLQITKNVAPATGGTGCMFTGTPSELFIPHGFVDPNAAGYVLHPQVQSRISVTDSTDPNQVAQRTVIITDGDVDVTFPNSTLFSASEVATLKSTGVTHFKGLLSAPVPPNGTTDTEIEVIHKDLIDAIVAKNPSSDVEMLVSLVYNGDMSGATVSSQQFDYPVTLTNLVQNAGACPLPMGTAVLTGNPCGVFQDDAVTCCSSGTSLVCPATVSAN